MLTETLFEMTSPYRDNFRIRGFRFGEGEKTLAVVGSMRGDEIQQQFICAQLTRRLRRLEEQGCFRPGHSVLVIPSCNPFSMNVSRRFWAMDGTDINRMFPGYDKGETTQRIAAALFRRLQGFAYGIQMASFYIPGSFIPHVRMLDTGYEDTDTARLFGLQFVTVRKPLPFDTTLLNYNWQVWNTKAYSLYAGPSDRVEDKTSRQAVEAILRFMNKVGIISQKQQSVSYESLVINERELLNVTAAQAGIFYLLHGAGERVTEGDVLARIIDPFTADVRQEVKAPADGTVFFAHNRPLALESALIFRIYPD